jgi:MYXO-CTERM domain-containing protein
MFEYASMRISRLSSSLGSLVLCLAASSTALAGTPDLSAPNDMGPDIFDGDLANPCAWPTVVSIGGCTATLIHPEVILYAAHCGGGNKTARFGNTQQGDFNVGTQYCRTYPDYQVTGDEHIDWAFCVLDYAVNIPIAPPVMGCEWDDVKADDDVAIVGYGQTYNGGGGGTKQWAMTKINGVSWWGDDPGNVAEVGMGGAGSCPGDSGGPAFKRFPDGSWRQFGIVSTGTADSCDETTTHTYSLTRNAVPWVEQESGIDITPCTDAEGYWEGGPGCTGFYSNDPGAYFGTWDNGCLGGPVSGPVNTCGPANGEPADDSGPVVTITNPADGSAFPNPTTVELEIDAQDDYAVEGVRLEIDGVDVGAWTPETPYGFDVNFADDGVYSLQANAIDWSGNIGYSNTIQIAIGDVDPPDPTGGDTTETGGGTTDSGETTDTGDTASDTNADDASTSVSTGTSGSLDDGGEPSGCACRSGGTRGGGLAWAAMVLLLGAGRRRRSV